MKENCMKIVIVGAGYVGLSNAALLAQYNDVIALDVSRERIESINKRECPLKDKELEDFFKNKKLSLIATDKYEVACENADFIIISTPTNYDPSSNAFDTASVEIAIASVLKINSTATIVIKSTVPIGFVKKMKKKFDYPNIFFSPEFLREGTALYDNLYPSRIIIGDKSDRGRLFSELLIDAALKENIEVLFTNSDEAESIKLFSNTYLAMRISFFNELDTYAMLKGLDSKQIIDGVCLDPRVGNYYSNPSFGYGGYCLPKDTKQLLANYENVPQDLLSAIVASNDTRKECIANYIVSKSPNIVGIYRLVMKSGSDNYRDSAIQDIIIKLKNNGIKVVIYEPTLNKNEFFKSPVETSLNNFKNISDLIIANRIDENVKDVAFKTFSRDLYYNN